MSLWKRKTRQEMLDWFSTLDDDMLEKVWREARDRHFPKTMEENFICRGCHHNVPGLDCTAPKSMGITSHKDCEKAVSSDPLEWLLRVKDPLFEEGREDFEFGYELEDCPHDSGTDGEVSWKNGWRKASALSRDKLKEGKA